MVSANQQVAGALLAAWLGQNFPELYNELIIRAGNPTGAPPNVQLSPPPDKGLAGFTDVLSSIWGGITKVATNVASGLSSTVQGVGNFLASKEGASALATLAVAKYGASSSQASVIGTQLNRTQAGQTPAPIQTVYDPATQTYVPVLTQNGVNYPVNNQVLQQLQPSFLDRYGMWIAIGGIGLIALTLIIPRR